MYIFFMVLLIYQLTLINSLGNKCNFKNIFIKQLFYICSYLTNFNKKKMIEENNLILKKNIEISSEIGIRWKNLIEKILRKNNFSKSINIIRWKNLFQEVLKQARWKNNYNQIIKQVNSELNYFHWKKNNSLIQHIDNYDLVIINLECFYLLHLDYLL